MILHRSELYGLGVHSDIPLWGDGLVSCRADVMVRLDRETPVSDAGAGKEEVVRREPDTVLLTWPGVAEMSVRAGTEITVRAAAQTDGTHLRYLVGGIGMGVILHQRGVFTLHASAVEVDGQAVALAGATGAGKSTLAAALSARGHRVLSDDVAALALPTDSRPQLLPGVASLTLWPDSALATGHDPDALPSTWPGSPKVVRPVDAEPPPPVPLGAVMILTGTGSTPRLETLAPLEAFRHLAAHSLSSRWEESVSGLPRHFGQCNQVLRSVPVYRIERGESLDSLPELVRRVEDRVTAVPSLG